MSEDNSVNDRGDYRSSWNTAMYANEQLYEVQDWCQSAAMNYQYRDWCKALYRYLTILSPLMSKSDYKEVSDNIQSLRNKSRSYTSSDEDALFDSLTAVESSLRIMQNEVGLGFALDEVQQVVEGDDEGVDKLIVMMQDRNSILENLLDQHQRNKIKEQEEQVLEDIEGE